MKPLSAHIVLAIFLVSTAFSQNIRQKIELAEHFGRDASALILRNEVRPFWSEDGSKLVYRVNTEQNGHRFFQIDLKSAAKTPAFDHEMLAQALAKAASQQVRASALPLESVEISADPAIVRFRAFGKGWCYEAAKELVSPDNVPPKSANLLAPEEAMRATHNNSGPTALTIENGTTGKIEPSPQQRDDLSPDGKWRATIRDHNLVIAATAGDDIISLSSDGKPNHPYCGPFKWSPDSKKLIAWRVKEVKPRQVYMVQSSPPDQVQPKLKTINYPKPGDEIRQPKPRLFDIEKRREIPINDKDFNNPWSIDQLAWSADSSEFSFLYNQRGHQVMRIIAIRGDSGSTRVILEERSKTFIDYSQKTWLHRLPATRELLWASERDGFNHLYLIDEVSGQIKNQITTGQWNVREVIEVDADRRRLLLKVLGLPGQDPYHTHFARINFDGSGFTRLTTSDGHHRIEFSPNGKWIIAKWSRVDQPQVVEIRDATTGKLLTEIERADDSALLKTGWSRPERFTAKGRDGKTDIFGIITRPVGFDPAKKYPVLESIYAGPHDHFVRKNYATWSGENAMAELGFVVVNIDGMGTNWRGKIFHDVCWKNLADSGFLDRIAWIKAAAATRPSLDLSKIGIYGGSAGGQSALAGLLHHGDFYKVGVADCGCHDNRMDKIWWNEAWMGWPVDESYVLNSNVTHAAKLTGKLMLVVGELDDNVDPASTAQVVAALQKAGKNFDFVPIMNANHGAAETSYGKYRRAEFLVRHLQGNE